VTLIISSEQPEDQANDSITGDIISAVADEAGVDPLELPPLYTAVDGDALATLCDTPRKNTPLTVEFEYAGYLITVDVTEDVDFTVEEL